MRLSCFDMLCICALRLPSQPASCCALLPTVFYHCLLVVQLHELFENVGDEAPPPPGRDVSAEEWLRSKGASELQLEVADVCYANDFGCDVRQLGLREMITENNRWDSGETYLILDKPMSALVDELRRGLTIRTGCPITSITHSPAGAVLTGPTGVRLAARKVVVTASLAVLKQGKIQFSPALPAAKTTAIQRLRFGNAAKVGSPCTCSII